METDALSLERNMPSHPENHHHYKQCQILIKIFQFKETQKKKKVKISNESMQHSSEFFKSRLNLFWVEKN